MIKALRKEILTIKFLLLGEEMFEGSSHGEAKRKALLDYLDKELKVLRVLRDFKPWHFSPWVLGAGGVLELPAGRCEGRLEEGDTLEFIG